MHIRYSGAIQIILLNCLKIKLNLIKFRAIGKKYTIWIHRLLNTFIWGKYICICTVCVVCVCLPVDFMQLFKYKLRGDRDTTLWSKQHWMKSDGLNEKCMACSAVSNSLYIGYRYRCAVSLKACCHHKTLVSLDSRTLGRGTCGL